MKFILYTNRMSLYTEVMRKYISNTAKYGGLTRVWGFNSWSASYRRESKKKYEGNS